MAEFLIYAREHPFDGMTQAEVDAETLKDPIFPCKYQCRLQKGDPIEMKPNGFWIDRWDSKFPTFVVIQVTDLSEEAGIKYIRPWRREVSAQLISSDTENHIYDYRITVTPAGTSLADRFDDVRDIFKSLPVDISLVSKSANEVVMRHQPLLHLGVIAGTRTVEDRIQRVRDEAKDIIGDFQQTIRAKRYMIDYLNTPIAIRNKLRDDGYIIVTRAQMQPYIIDKANP